MREVNNMAKKDMKHYYTKHGDTKAVTVPELSGKAKTGKEKARPLIAGGEGKVYHAVPGVNTGSPAFGALDNDLAIEKLENDFDMTDADLQDFKRKMH